jgi:hypothetical protein
MINLGGIASGQHKRGIQAILPWDLALLAEKPR